MTERSVTDEILNAYVDGELPPDERARITASLARNPEIAMRVALLARLKAAVAESAGAAPEPLRRRAQQPWWRGRSIRCAAAAAMVLLAITVIWAVRLEPGREREAWVERGLAEHIAWTQEPGGNSQGALDAELLLATVEALDHPMHIPDMRSAKLHLTGARFVKPSAGTNAGGVQLKYTGARGCRVTLWISPASSVISSSLTDFQMGVRRGYYWRVADTGYAIFATGMEPRRFDLLARNTYRTTRNRRRPPAHWRDELRSASNAAPPCAA